MKEKVCRCAFCGKPTKSIDEVYCSEECGKKHTQLVKQLKEELLEEIISKLFSESFRKKERLCVKCGSKFKKGGKDLCMNCLINS